MTNNRVYFQMLFAQEAIFHLKREIHGIGELGLEKLCQAKIVELHEQLRLLKRMI